MNGPPRDAAPVDVLVVGSGAAGMSVALALAPLRVAILTKTPTLAGGASPLAQGGVAAAVGPRDDTSWHAADTLAAGAGLGDPGAVQRLTAAGPGTIARLIALGARFDRDEAGRLALHREGAHGCARVVRAGGDATGAEIVRTLSAAVLEASSVEIRADTFAEDFVREAGELVGLVATEADGASARHRARAVVLATGGIGRLFPATTNPAEATGDGLALAARAGALLADLEFVQFHPTALDVARDPMPLITEALRGSGAILVDARGRPIRIEGWERPELAPRDVVASEIASRVARGERVALDARALGAERLEAEFPQVIRSCGAAGFDPRTDVLPVAPAAHYHMGGVATDARGRTSVPGLWACGEVACTGAHGANRLASNSLLEALADGAKVAADVRASLRGPALATSGRDEPHGRRRAAAPWKASARLEARLRAAVGRGVGVLRDAAGLRETLDALDVLSEEPLVGEARNMVLVGRLVASAALAREESRGAHRRRDFPEPDPARTERFARSANELLAICAAV